MIGRDGTLWKIAGCLPLVKQLREVPAEALKEAASEVLTTTIFAAMPFWFPIVAWFFLNDPPDFFDSVRNGELLIYAATLVGPVAFIITKRYGKFVAESPDGDDTDWPLTYPFPMGRQSAIIAMIICTISGIVITLQKLQESDSLKSIQLINKNGLALASVAIFILATMLLYCVSAYRNFMDLSALAHATRISRAQSEAEDDLADQWHARRQVQ